MKLITDNYISEFNDAVEKAQRFLYINSYTISPPLLSLGLRFKSVWDSISKAAERGIEIKILVDGGAESKMLLDNLRRFFDFKMPENINIKLLGMGKKLHAKFFIIDDTWFCVGSHNFTKRGLNNPFELSLLIKNPEIATRLKTYFLGMWGLGYVYKATINTTRNVN